MKLSMWNLYYALGNHDMVPLIKDGSPTITCARWIVTSHLNADAVFIGREAEFFGERSDSAIMVHRHDMILVRDMAAEELFNEVSIIMDRFEAWDEELQQLLNEDEDGLQKMLEASRDIFRHPAFIYGPDGKALAISTGYPPELHWHWKEILDNHGITEERLHSLKTSIRLSEVFLDSFPTIRDSRMGNHQYMHCSLRANNYMAGHLVLFSMNAPFEKGLEFLVDNFVRWSSQYVKTHYEKYSPTSWLARIVELLLTDQKYDESELQLLMKTLRWNEGDVFQLYLFREAVEGEPVIMARLYLELSNTLSSSVVLQRGRELLILENTSCPGGVGVNDVLNSILTRGFICGVSNIFAGLKRLNSYYNQAHEELERAARKKRNFSLAEEHTLDHYLTVLEADPLARTYVDRLLLLLRDYDRAHGTQYYQTLRLFCYTGFQLSETARLLGIHRNSLTYRLDRIRETIDFSSFDRLMDERNPQQMNALFLSFIMIDNGLV